jgi:ABC-type Fe3+-citrate transport system substrate-binding protein
VTNTQVYKTLLSIVFAILVMLVFMVAVTGCQQSEIVDCGSKMYSRLEYCHDNKGTTMPIQSGKVLVLVPFDYVNCVESAVDKRDECEARNEELRLSGQ